MTADEAYKLGEKVGGKLADWMEQVIQAAVAEEREACAKAAEALGYGKALHSAASYHAPVLAEFDFGQAPGRQDLGAG